MRVLISSILASCFCTHLGHATTSINGRHGLCSSDAFQTADPDLCISIADFYREIAYDIAADISQRAAQSSASPIKGCNRGVHWYGGAVEQSNKVPITYDEVIKALDIHLGEVLGGEVCGVECVRFVSKDGWSTKMALGSNKAAVQEQSACETSSNSDLDHINHVSNGLTVQRT